MEDKYYLLESKLSLATSENVHAIRVIVKGGMWNGV